MQNSYWQIVGRILIKEKLFSEKKETFEHHRPHLPVAHLEQKRLETYTKHKHLVPFHLGV